MASCTDRLLQPRCTGPCVPSLSLTWDIYPMITILKRTIHDYAVLILNRPLSQNQDFLKGFWNDASVRVTVDGGTNRWDKFVTSLPEAVQKSMKLPDLITGDFDSISDEILQKYKKQGCQTVKTPDQNYTDFTKALIELTKYCQEHEIKIQHIVAIGQCGGRLDQALGNVQTLHIAKEQHLLKPNISLYLITDDAISWLLLPGSHIITVPEETLKYRKAWCSLVPVGEPCFSVTTTGLKWNLTNHILKFGGLISTSNAFNGEKEVRVKCSQPLLWTMKLPSITGPKNEI